MLQKRKRKSKIGRLWIVRRDETRDCKREIQVKD